MHADSVEDDRRPVGSPILYTPGQLRVPPLNRSHGDVVRSSERVLRTPSQDHKRSSHNDRTRSRSRSRNRRRSLKYKEEELETERE